MWQRIFRRAGNPWEGGERTETVIARTTSVQGLLKAGGLVEIYGSFQGQLETSGSLLVGPEARVSADIRAHSVGVAGLIQGNIEAEARVEILPNGRVYGDITTRALRIEEGAVFSGMSTMKETPLPWTPPVMAEAEEENSTPPRD